MQVLGELMLIDPSFEKIPLPWYHRAPLGFENNTNVSVTLIENVTRPICDIVISIFEPDQWKNLYRFSLIKKEQPGVINNIFESIPNWNIVLTESVTQEGGINHITSLICEPIISGDIKSELEYLETIFSKKGYIFSYKKVFIEIPKTLKTKPRRVKNGCVEDCGWIRYFLNEHYKSEVKNGDTQKVVVTADTRLRLMRFVFSGKESVSADIEHSERQGSLKTITKSLTQNSEINILSSLSNKSSVSKGLAKFRIVCESKNPAKKTIDLIKSRIRELDKDYPQLSLEVLKSHSGRSAMDLIYCKHPDDIIAKVAPHISVYIKKFRREIPKGKFPIFLSRRFISNENTKKVIKRIGEILEELNCFVVEAFPKSGDRTAASLEVKSKMWISKAGIVLIHDPEQIDHKEPVGMNLPHEYGFLDGQGKPILLLKEGNNFKLSDNWSNIEGDKPTIFPIGDSGLNPDNFDSLDKKIKEWVESIR